MCIRDRRKEITNYQDLLEAEKILTELIADINSVEQQISEIGTVTLSKEKIIEATRQAYDSLPEDSKKGVTNYKDLVNAERTLDALKKEIDDVIASINAIGEVTYAKSSVIQMTREAYTCLLYTSRCV